MKPKQIEIVLLLSGGLDSVTALYHYRQEGRSIHCLCFDYKQQHVQEILFAKVHCQRLGVPYTTLDLPALNGLTEKSWIVPNRNAILISVAVNKAAQLGASIVAIGCNAEDADYFPDCRREFIDAMNTAVKSAGYKITIEAPFLEWSKWKIGGLAREMGVPMHEIWSCYKGGQEPCGVCPACLKLKTALA